MLGSNARIAISMHLVKSKPTSEVQYDYKPSYTYNSQGTEPATLGL